MQRCAQQSTDDAQSEGAAQLGSRFECEEEFAGRRGQELESVAVRSRESHMGATKHELES